MTKLTVTLPGAGALNRIPLLLGLTDTITPDVSFTYLTKPAKSFPKVRPPDRPEYVPSKSVTFKFGEDVKKLNLPAGSQASVAVYTDSFRFLVIVRRILLRIQSWENYLFIP